MSGISLAFLFISTYNLFDLCSLSSAEAYIGRSGKLTAHLMASCVRNIHTKNYQNLIVGALAAGISPFAKILWSLYFFLTPTLELCCVDSVTGSQRKRIVWRWLSRLISTVCLQVHALLSIEVWIRQQRLLPVPPASLKRQHASGNYLLRLDWLWINARGFFESQAT